MKGAERMDYKSIAKLKGGGIASVETSTYYESGCPTCDYGSKYDNDITICFVSGNKLDVCARRMYEYICSESDIIRIIANRPDDVDEAGFCNYFVDEIRLLCGDDAYLDAPEISVRFSGSDGKLIKTFSVECSSATRNKWALTSRWKRNNNQYENKMEDAAE